MTNTWTPDHIRAACDQVRVMPDLAPDKDAKGNIIATHCNSNAFRVASALGLDLFYDKTQKRIQLANEMYASMAAPASGFQRTQSHIDAFKAANAGRLVFAAQAEIGHGHIAPVYPIRGMVLSGNWKCECPYVSNVGKDVGVMGANYAFHTPPDYFIYGEV